MVTFLSNQAVKWSAYENKNHPEIPEVCKNGAFVLFLKEVIVKDEENWSEAVSAVNTVVRQSRLPSNSEAILNDLVAENIIADSMVNETERFL